MITKAVQLTEDEIKCVIQYHARQINQSADGYSEYIERMKYLDKRFNDFNKKSNATTEQTGEWNDKAQA